jgi:hypothetical protein
MGLHVVSDIGFCGSAAFRAESLWLSGAAPFLN